MASAVALLGSSTVFALSVGEPVVQSKLGQPLDAWIPISLESPEEIEALDSFTASLAGADVYVARSLDVPVATLGVLQLKSQTTGDQVRLHLTSQQPFVEPMSTLLVKVGLGKISILRELPLLLDLQGAAVAEPVAVAPSAPAEKTEPVPVASVPATAVKSSTRAQRKNVEMPAVAATVAPAAPQVVSHMFQLDQRFSSYAQLAAAGKAPLPVTQPVAAPEAAAPQENVLGGEAPAATPSPARQPSSSNGILWVVGFAFLLAMLLSNARAKLVLADWLKRIKASLQARDIEPLQMPVAAPLPIRPNQKAVKAAEFNVRSDDVVPEEQTLSALTSRPAKSVAAPAPGVSAERQRITQLQKQFVSDEAKQKLKLAEAYLELNRTDAAMRLMDEVERLQQSVGDRRLALVKR